MADSSSKQVQHTGNRYGNLNSFFLPYSISLATVGCIILVISTNIVSFILQVVIRVGDWRLGDRRARRKGEQSEKERGGKRGKASEE